MREDAVRYFAQLGYQLVGQNPADFFIEVAFGYEKNSKTPRELPECFGRIKYCRCLRSDTTVLDLKRGLR